MPRYGECSTCLYWKRTELHINGTSSDDQVFGSCRLAMTDCGTPAMPGSEAFAVTLEGSRTELLTTAAFSCSQYEGCREQD